jgi:hypothetical protein
MKNIRYSLCWLVLPLLLAACELDNYEPPKSTLTGRIVFNGEPLNVAFNEVTFQLWEPGWQTSVPINVTVDQDGSYSALLFNASYKMVFPRNQGPFRSVAGGDAGSDTLLVTVSGNQTLDIEVVPYYMLRNAQFSAGGSTVSAACQLEQILQGADARTLEKVFLYLNKTTFVDSRTSIATTELAAADIADPNNIRLSVNVPAMVPSQSYVFARIGVKISGVEDMLFSPVQKIDL